MTEPSDPPRGDSDSELPLVDELRRLGDDARNYAEAELAFQKTRAALVGKAVRKVAILGVTALVIAVFALVALVVGLLLALASAVGTWGAIGIVVGSMVLIAVICVRLARARWKRMLALFAARSDQR